MEFCDKCGSLLAPKKINGKVIMTCPKCGEGKELSKGNQMLKQEIKDTFTERAKELEMAPEDCLSKIADETTATTEEEVLEFITKAGHPVTSLEPMF